MSRLLISVAASVRVIQDRDRGPDALLNATCGKLYPDRAVRSHEPLTLREACNKLIHAVRFNFDVKPLPPSERGLPYPTYTLRPFLHLYGTHGGTEWKASLDVVRFVHANASLIRG